MRDERGIDYGMVTGIGVAIVSAIVLLAVFAALRSAAPAGETMMLRSASSRVAEDIDTVSMLGVPYLVEEAYDINGIDMYIGSDHVLAVAGDSSFNRPLTRRIYPGMYEEGGIVLWNDPGGFREYLNVTLGAPGTEDSPLRAESVESMHMVLERAMRSMASMPVHFVPGHSLAVEKLYVHYETETAGGPTREACVFAYIR